MRTLGIALGVAGTFAAAMALIYSKPDVWSQWVALLWAAAFTLQEIGKSPR